MVYHRILNRVPYAIHLGLIVDPVLYIYTSLHLLTLDSQSSPHAPPAVLPSPLAPCAILISDC